MRLNNIAWSWKKATGTFPCWSALSEKFRNRANSKLKGPNCKNKEFNCGKNNLKKNVSVSTTKWEWNLKKYQSWMIRLLHWQSKSRNNKLSWKNSKEGSNHWKRAILIRKSLNCKLWLMKLTLKPRNCKRLKIRLKLMRKLSKLVKMSSKKLKSKSRIKERKSHKFKRIWKKNLFN